MRRRRFRRHNRLSARRGNEHQIGEIDGILSGKPSPRKMISQLLEVWLAK
jgi:hypothetical protein